MATQTSLNDVGIDKQLPDLHRCPENFKYTNAQQYAQSLRSWLWQYHNACVMQNLASSFAIQAPAFMPFNITYSGYNEPQPDAIRNRFAPYGVNRSPHVQNTIPASVPTNRQPEASPQQPLQGIVFKVPTFWKRIVAELIDFTFLFYIKMTVSLFLMTEFSFDQLSFFSTEDILDNFSEFDYDKAFAITFEVIALEIMNRILITIFETLCLYRPQLRPGGHGATPGKRLLGLKVVSCDQVQSLGGGQVLVSPAGQISFKNAFLRSALKNFTIAFFLPVCLTLFFFKHNRAAYDIVAHTIVVEDRKKILYRYMYLVLTTEKNNSEKLKSM
ncbi:Protein fam8a1 [Bulinus truncatus]|nr:Protein fam8a1 [Bulinus truncatus]